MCHDCYQTPPPAQDCYTPPATSCAGCEEVHDTSCIKYRKNDPTSYSQLSYLGLPSGVSLQQFMEAVDAKLSQLNARLKALE